MKKVMILVAAAAMAMAPMAASARVFFGGGFYGPRFYGPGFYGPEFYGPAYWGPGYYGYPGVVTGEVKIDTKSKADEVFINGAFAGVTKDMKTFHLRQGTYDIEVRNAGQSELKE